MRAKLVKIIMVAMAIAFFGAGVSMAQDWKGGHHNSAKGRAYGHYKQDKNHKVVQKRYIRKYHDHKHYNCPQCRPVVVHQHSHQYRTYEPYPYHAGQFVAFSFLDPNVAFSVAVRGH